MLSWGSWMSAVGFFSFLFTAQELIYSLVYLQQGWGCICRVANPLRGLIDGGASASVVLDTVKAAGTVPRMWYDVLLWECLRSKGSLGHVLLGLLPWALTEPGAAHVAGNAAELQGWPLSAEGFWCPCGSHRRFFGVSSVFKEQAPRDSVLALETSSLLTTELLKWQSLLCFHKSLLTQHCPCANANVLGAGHDEDPDLFCVDPIAARLPVKQPSCVLLGCGHPHDVVPVLGRACMHSQELPTTGWSCWMWCLAEQPLDLMRYIEEKCLWLFERVLLPFQGSRPFLHITLGSFSLWGRCDGHWSGMW